MDYVTFEIVAPAPESVGKGRRAGSGLCWAARETQAWLRREEKKK